MNDSPIDSLEKVRQFLGGTDEVDLAIDGKRNRYDFIKRTLMRFKYRTLKREDKGLLLRYMARISGYSHVQVKRLAARYLKEGRLTWRHTASRGFARKYRDKDCRLLAQTDELHGTLSGPATKKLCERALLVYDQQEYANLAGISVSRYRTYTICVNPTPINAAADTSRKPALKPLPLASDASLSPTVNPATSV